MPRFFIDTDDGRTGFVDEDGYELADPHAARDLAVRALSDMARSGSTASDQRILTARVRAEDGSTLYSASLTLSGEWWIDRAAS